MTHSCPTIKIVFDNEQGFALLDASAFDPKVHTEYVEPAAPKAPPQSLDAKSPVVTKFTKAK